MSTGQRTAAGTTGTRTSRATSMTFLNLDNSGQLHAMREEMLERHQQRRQRLLTEEHHWTALARALTKALTTAAETRKIR